MKEISIALLFSLLTIITVWYISTNNNQTIVKSLEKYERNLRDSLMKDLDRQRVERLLLQVHIDSLSSSIKSQKTELTKQITKIKYETITQVRNYSNASDSALLSRLRSE